MDHLSFQDLIHGNHCWGCGTLNQQGLKISSRWDGDGSVCTWQPQRYHSAGPSHVLNGGVIATIIDCHCVCTAIAAAYRSEGREIGTEPSIWYATASLQIAYRRPTPIEAAVTLRAAISDMTERKTVLSCSLLAGREECASAEVVAVRVPTEWMASVVPS